MRSFLKRLVPQRKRVSLAGLLLIVALLACLFNWLRPISRSEAIRIATNQFQQMPGSEPWANSKARAFPSQGSDGLIWVVDFDDSATGRTVAQVSLDRDGRRLSTVLGY